MHLKLFLQPVDPVEPMWINEDGIINVITQRSVKIAADPRNLSTTVFKTVRLATLMQMTTQADHISSFRFKSSSEAKFDNEFL